MRELRELRAAAQRPGGAGGGDENRNCSNAAATQAAAAAPGEQARQEGEQRGGKQLPRRGGRSGGELAIVDSDDEQRGQRQGLHSRSPGGRGAQREEEVVESDGECAPRWRRPPAAGAFGAPAAAAAIPLLQPAPAPALLAGGPSAGVPCLLELAPAGSVSPSPAG